VCLDYSGARAGALVLTKQTPDLLAGIARGLWSLGALLGTLVWDRQSGLHAHAGRPAEEFAASCGQVKVDWHLREPPDPQARAASSCAAAPSTGSSRSASDEAGGTRRTFRLIQPDRNWQHAAVCSDAGRGAPGTSARKRR